MYYFLASLNTNHRQKFYLCLRLLSAIVLALAASSIFPAVSNAQVNVLTQRYSPGRDGQNLHETILNTNNVNVYQFGKLFTRPVDGQMYAQPLYMSNLTMPDGLQHNVVFLATMHNSVYAYDADDPAVNTPLWEKHFGGSVVIPNAWIGWSGFANIKSELGIVSTPVIDPSTGILYLVAFTQDAVGGPYHHSLHALNLTTGQEMLGGPTVITGTYPGTGYGVDVFNKIQDRANGNLVFTSRRHLQRPSLLLTKGNIIIAFGSEGDIEPYHGWVFAYNALSLQQTGVWVATPNGSEGGIWQAGQGLAADANGDIYTIIGNGTLDINRQNYGDSFVKLSMTDAGLSVLDYFTPFNQAWMALYDVDLGSSGPMILPNTNYVVGGGKLSRMYVLNRNNLGQYNPSNDNQIVQWWGVGNGHIHGTPTYWNGPAGPFMYVWVENDYLKSYKFLNTGVFQYPAYKKSAMPASPGMPGGFLSISANGSTAGSGILWSALPYNGDAWKATVPGIVRAFDPVTLTELWNSQMESTGRDALGNFGKNVPPVVANGKLYVSTFSNQLAVYGLMPLASPQITPNGGIFTTPQQVTIADVTAGTDIHYTLDGSIPTVNSPVYNGPIALSSTTTVKAIAFANGLTSSITSTRLIFAVYVPILAASSVRAGTYADINVYSPSTFAVRRSNANSADVTNRAAYLKVDLTGFSAPPKVAFLAITPDTTSIPNAGLVNFSVFGVSDTSWSETGITWNNAPGFNPLNFTSTGTLITATKVNFVPGQQYVDITSYIASHVGQVITLQILNQINDGAYQIYRGRLAAGAPQVVLGY